jgi:membrane AbrB-like protein
MQYLRVIAVAMTASIVAAYGFGADAPPQQMVWFPPVDWQALAIMLAVASASAAAGRFVPIPSGTLLLPTIVTAVLHAAGWLTIELPGWLLAIAYALVGWRIGLAFTRRILMHAFSALPQIAGSILVLIVFCAGLGWLVHLALGVDPLSAYLATSPGGLDAVAIIAASTPVDVQFVMALQTLRLFVIMLLGPWIARFVASLVAGGNGKT